MKKKASSFLYILIVIAVATGTVWLLTCVFHNEKPQPLYNNIVIEETDSLIFFYPQFDTLDLVCGAEVPMRDSSLFCCCAAFTAHCLDTFAHDNIRCNHVSAGILYAGSDEPVCTGVFTFYDGKAHFDFANHAALDSAAARHGMGFQQILILRNDSVVSSDSLQNLFRKSFVFRSLAEKDGKLCLVQSKDTLPYPQYVNLLAKAKVSNAIYLDMGGWSHGYYRDNFGKLQYLGEESNPYSTNWILFGK